MMTQTTSEDADIQHTSNIACINAYRVGQTSCSTIHQSLCYNGIGPLFIHSVSHHLRLTVCRATGPAAGEPILSRTVSASSGTLQGVQCHGAHHEGIKSAHHDSAYHSYDNLSDGLCLKLVCYPSTEADSCPSAPLASKAVCWHSKMCASSQHCMSEDMYTNSCTCCCWPFQRQRTAWSHGVLVSVSQNWCSAAERQGSAT